MSRDQLYTFRDMLAILDIPFDYSMSGDLSFTVNGKHYLVGRNNFSPDASYHVLVSTSRFDDILGIIFEEEE